MTSLHASFTLRNQQAFQRLLESTARGQPASAPTLTSSGGRSWSKPTPLSAITHTAGDVNARDWLGRTALHLAVSSTDSAALEYVRLLLAHPRIDVNALDTESHWSALHRALYEGNIAASLLLLQRPDTDTSLKDKDGYTAFDLYNSTVDGTKPDVNAPADLYTWGANRNATLGVGDGDDRLHPDQITIPAQHDTETGPLDKRFPHIRVRQVAMAKLHTTVVSEENRANIRMCGFGSGGRLGPGHHMRYALAPPADFPHAVAAVALGQDHTLARTRDGAVLSWGLNRFAQLGYIVEAALSGLPARALALGAVEEPIQAVPRRVQGALRREVVQGVAACKTASAAWTAAEVFTWGTNSGQLGYDRASTPVQVTPRKVTHITVPVLGIAMTDSAMACILSDRDVLCFWNNRHFRINFQTQNFPAEIQTYGPPLDARIVKITSGESTFAALSSHGEVYTFTLPAPPPTALDSTGATKDKPALIPQRVWALRKQFTAVNDVALASDDAIVLCTEAGHVYVGARRAKGAHAHAQTSHKAFKFQRVAGLTRVVQVSANASGAFGALRVDPAPPPVVVVGNAPAQDLALVQPFVGLRAGEGGGGADVIAGPAAAVGEDAEEGEEGEEGEESAGFQRDIKSVVGLCGVLLRGGDGVGGGGGDGQFAHGADLIVQVSAVCELPVHRVVLAARCAALGRVLRGDVLSDGAVTIQLGAQRGTRLPLLCFAGCHPLSVAILLVYLYTDELLAVWDRRIGNSVNHLLATLEAGAAQVKAELQTLARMLSLPHLFEALTPPVKRIPVPTIRDDMRALFVTAQGTHPDTPPSPIPHTDPLAADTILDLGDRRVFCHSAVLRARSAFFSGLFGDSVWTAKRWQADGTITVHLRHLHWRVMSFVLRHIYGGDGEEMFESLDFVSSVDELLEFMFEIMAAASELLLDRLLLVSSAIILQRVNVGNICAILSEATYYHATRLMESIQSYMTCNMETLLEGRLLFDLSPDLIKQLSAFVRTQQARKLPVIRSNRLVKDAVDRCSEWLAAQDIPQPIMRSVRGPVHRSPKLSPTALGRTSRPSPPLASPALLPHSELPRGDDVFSMDVIETNAEMRRQVSAGSDIAVAAVAAGTPPSPWKSKALQLPPRVDMKTIMAEAEGRKANAAPEPGMRILGFHPVSATSGLASKAPAKTSQRERRKMLVTDGEHEQAAPGPERPSNSPWRLPVSSGPGAPILTPAASGIKQGSPSGVSRALEEAESARRASPAPVPGPSDAISAAQARQSKPGMGPMFSPSRQASSGRVVSTPPRRVPDTPSAAWTAPGVVPVESPPTASPKSFLAIQQQQRAQGLTPSRSKRSLREIQEEERTRHEAEEAVRAEEEFLRWWAEEERQVQAEAAVVPAKGAGKRGKRVPPFKGAKDGTSRAEGEVKAPRPGRGRNNPRPVNARPATPQTI